MTGLTPRDLEVLTAYVQHESQKVAAEELGVTPGTVKTHMSASYRRLGTDNIIGALKALGWLRVQSHGMGL